MKEWHLVCGFLAFGRRINKRIEMNALKGTNFTG
jgi:hypothetical protein